MHNSVVFLSPLPACFICFWFCFTSSFSKILILVEEEMLKLNQELDHKQPWAPVRAASWVPQGVSQRPLNPNMTWLEYQHAAPAGFSALASLLLLFQTPSLSPSAHSEFLDASQILHPMSTSHFCSPGLLSPFLACLCLHAASPEHHGTEQDAAAPGRHSPKGRDVACTL